MSYSMKLVIAKNAIKIITTQRTKSHESMIEGYLMGEQMFYIR